MKRLKITFDNFANATKNEFQVSTTKHQPAVLKFNNNSDSLHEPCITFCTHFEHNSYERNRRCRHRLLTCPALYIILYACLLHVPLFTSFCMHACYMSRINRQQMTTYLNNEYTRGYKKCLQRLAGKPLGVGSLEERLGNARMTLRCYGKTEEGVAAGPKHVVYRGW